ncbi:MAG: YHYH protein [Saprospiraceae bacterium]|nr:YHYH protein [Saprospiraceae bacterium]
MKRIFLYSAFLFVHFLTKTTAQTNPVITKWLQNTTVTGRYYTSGNSTAISNGVLANCQAIQYSSSWVYVTTKGIPSYPTGPFLDGNPSVASNQNAIFKLPLTPQQNTGTPTNTTGGNIGLFINGVALFDYRDGVSWRNSTNSLAGGPIGGAGDGVWNRDAVVAEKSGFDCSKGHPAMGNYHHHQNPSAFDLDLVVISNICNLYDSDGLYVINSATHSPLIGFAYDGFPIYGAYAYKNTNGTGGIVRMKSGFQLRNITTRTHYANGTDVTDGPSVNTTYPLGYFREDYEYVAHPSDPDYLDEHNGRFCVTPEYPNGTYAYFCTIDASHNSAYPYAVGPTFYGIKNAVKVTSITESVTTYTPIIPLTLLDFSDKEQADKSIKLTWTTVNEINTSHFEIEHSTDGKTFHNIGSIKSNNDKKQNAYTFADNKPDADINYYRLRQVDLDAHNTLSKTIAIYPRGESQQFKTFYDSRNDMIVIQSNFLNATDITVQVFNLSGQQMAETTLVQGASNDFIRTPHLQNGLYIVVLSSTTQQESLKVTINR